MNSSAGRGDNVPSPYHHDDLSEEHALEAEFRHLRLKYLQNRRDLAKYKEGSEKFIKKQNQQLGFLKHDHAELDLELYSQQEPPHTQAYFAEKLEQLMNENALKAARLEEEAMEISSLTAQIENARKRLIMATKNRGKLTSSEQYSALVKKRCRLENRLDHQLSLFGKQVTKNRELREKIRAMRKVHEKFMDMYNEVCSRLLQVKDRMTRLLQSSTKNFEDMDETKTMIETLRDRLENERQQHSLNVSQQKRQIIHETKAIDFYCTKANPRTELKRQEALKILKALASKGPSQESIQLGQYREAVHQMLELTGRNDLEEAVADLVRQENASFALFSYVNSLNGSIAELRRDANHLKSKTEQFQTDTTKLQIDHGMVQEQGKKEVEELRKEVVTWEAKVEELQQTLDACCTQVELILALLGDLVARPSVDPGTMSELTVRCGSLDLSLALIDQRVMELGHAQYYVVKKKKVPTATLR